MRLLGAAGRGVDVFLEFRSAAAARSSEFLGQDGLQEAFWIDVGFGKFRGFADAGSSELLGQDGVQEHLWMDC